MNENVKAAKCSRICTGFDLPADLQEALGPQLQQTCLAVQGPKNSNGLFVLLSGRVSHHSAVGARAGRLEEVARFYERGRGE